MPIPLTDEEIDALFGSISCLLEGLPAARIPGVAASFGSTRNLRSRLLAEAVETFQKGRTGRGEVNAAILKHRYKFENGGFVPVNALGEVSH